MILFISVMPFYQVFDARKVSTTETVLEADQEPK